MARKAKTESFETELSAFQGHLLNKIDKIPVAVTSRLADLGIGDAEQLAAAASVSGTRESLLDYLQISDRELESILQSATSAIPQSMQSTVEVQQAPLSLGGMEPTDEILEEMQMMMTETPVTLDVAALPTSVNYALQMPAIRNQGGRGTCVAFAMTAVHEFYRIRQGAPKDYSEQFLYHETKLIDGYPGTCGTWQVKAAQVLTNLGECREVIWPYNPSGSCNNNGVRPANARTDAASNKVSTIVLNPKDVGAIKAALSGGALVGVSVPVYNSWYLSAETKRTGRITMRIGNEAHVGGHAMCAVGYQDDANSPGGGFFILRNSWGTGWAYQSPYGAGYGTIPYAYISQLNWEAVTTPPGKRIIKPIWDWKQWEIKPWPFGEEEGQEPQAETKTIFIDAGPNVNIVIR